MTNGHQLWRRCRRYQKPPISWWSVAALRLNVQQTGARKLNKNALICAAVLISGDLCDNQLDTDAEDEEEEGMEY